MNSCICAICGNEKITHESWFLVVENPHEEQLRITHWDHRLAAAPSISHACGAAHVREILAQWITLGKLPSSRASSAQASNLAHKFHSYLWEIAGQNEPIGEIAVNRRGMPEKPEMLNAILEAIYCLVQNVSHKQDEIMETSSTLMFHAPFAQSSLLAVPSPFPYNSPHATANIP